MVFVCFNSQVLTLMRNKYMNISVILQFLKNKKMAFENKHTIAEDYFYYHVKKNHGFTHLVC